MTIVCCCHDSGWKAWMIAKEERLQIFGDSWSGSGQAFLRERYRPVVGDVSEIAGLIQGAFEASATGRVQSEPNPASVKTVLVLEDADQIAELVRDTLSNQLAYNVVVAHDGELAFEISRSIKPDVIILGIMLPGISGFEVYDALKEHEETANIPVIFVTRYGDWKGFESRQIAGKVIIEEPFDLADLLSRIESAIESARAPGGIKGVHIA